MKQDAGSSKKKRKFLEYNEILALLPEGGINIGWY